MKQLLFYGFFATALLIALSAGCKKQEQLTYKAVQLNLPEVTADYKSGMISSFGIDNEKATLGRVLFYDKILSLNNKTACASCHHQENAFADPVAFSTGFDGRKTTRNSMAIVNLNPNHNFFWDQRESDLTNMVLKPIENHVEMGIENLDYLPSKIKATAYYPALFKKAFGTEVVNNDRIAEALHDFVLSIQGRNSRFDTESGGSSWGSGTGTMSISELLGQQVFIGKGRCVNCHNGPNLNESTAFSNGSWSTSTSANIGLDMEYSDVGMGISNPEFTGHFKIPTLRNIALTAPYMHDGRFTTLAEVVEHYSSGIKNHPNLDDRLKLGNSGNNWIGEFTEAEKTGLVDFLKMMTDKTIAVEERFSNPFQE